MTLMFKPPQSAPATSLSIACRRRPRAAVAPSAATGERALRRSLLVLAAVLAACCALAPSALAFHQVSGSPFADSGEPWFVTFSPNGGLLATSNEGSDNFAEFTVNQSTGALTTVPGSPFSTSQETSDVAYSPSGNLLAVSVLQPPGKVYVFKVNPTTGALTTVAGSPFAVPLPPPGQEPSADTVSFSPNGSFLAVSDGNFGGGGLSMFTVNQSTGALTAVPGSQFLGSDTIVDAEFSPEGKYVAAVEWGKVYIFSVNQTTGELTNVTGSPFATEGYDRWLAFSPKGNLLATVNNLPAVFNGPSAVEVFSFNQTTGALTPVPGDPFDKHKGYAGKLAFNREGTELATTNGSKNKVSVFQVNTVTGALGTKKAGKTGAGPYGVAFSPNGALLATSNESGSVSVFKP
jgi:6-phosphogluconolactonase